MKIRNKYDGTIVESPSSIREDNHFYRLSSLGNCNLFFKYDGWEEVKEESNEQWHDLRKDPTDVPNNARDVWACFISQNKKFYKQAFYAKGEWHIMVSVLACSPPDAWCEFPKFEED